ncbi:MAG: hypothetical protein KAH18_12735 [Psychromonas sp.]|nr:hypothetical protein [Psychromonas sp.]
MFSLFKKKSSNTINTSNTSNISNNNRRENPNPTTDTNLPIFNPNLPKINIRFSKGQDSFTQDEMSLLGTNTNRSIYLIDEIKKSANNLFSEDLDKLEYWLGNLKTDRELAYEAHQHLYKLHETLHDDTQAITYVKRERHKRQEFTADEICETCAEVFDTKTQNHNPFGTEDEVLSVEDVGYQIYIDDDMFSDDTTVSQQIQIILHQMCRHANGINDVYAQEGIGNNKHRELDCLFYAGFSPNIARLNAGNWSLLYSNWNSPLTQQDWNFRGTLQVVNLKVKRRIVFYETDDDDTEDFVLGSVPKEEYEPSKWYCDTATCPCCDRVYEK